MKGKYCMMLIHSIYHRVFCLTITGFKHQVLQPTLLPLNFVNRQQLLDVIVTKLCDTTSNPDTSKNVIAVTGVGGFGKSTIVKALCHDPQAQKKFTSGFLFIELGPQAIDPKIKLNEIYFDLVGDNINNAEPELKKLTKDNLHNLLVIIDDVWHTEDAKPIINAFSNCHIVFTTRNNDIARSLTAFRHGSIVEIGSMSLDEAVTLLTDKLFELNKISNEVLELLKQLAMDAHMWPLLLCLIRGQLNHHLKRHVQENTVIKIIQGKLHERGLTAFDNNDLDLLNKFRNKSVSICIDTTLELLPKEILDKYITLILYTGIGGCFPKAATQSLWNTSDLQAKNSVNTLYAYGLVTFKNITISNHLKNQVVVHIHGVISQYIFDHVRSDQVANLSPFGVLHTNNSVGEKLVSLFKVSYGIQDLSSLTPREYLNYALYQTEYVVIPFHLKRITAHILHDPHVILLMLQKVQTTISTSSNHIKIVTQFCEQLISLTRNCKQSLKDGQIINRNINLKIQQFLYNRDYVKLEKTLEEHCGNSIGSLAQDSIELVNQIMPVCEDTLTGSFDFARQMLETLTPQHHFITLEKLPIIKLYIELHKDIFKSLKTGSTELYRMYTYAAHGNFRKKLELVSSNYRSKLQEIAPNVLSSSLAMYKK